MKKKLIILCFCVFFLSGCTANYNLDISKDTFKETLTLNNMSVSSKQLEIFTTNAMPVDFSKACYLDFDTDVEPSEVKEEKGGNYYKISPLDNEDGLIAKSTMKLEEYPNSRILNTPFVSNHVNIYDDFISIYGFDGVDIFNQYQTLDSFKVRITTDKEVTEHDADEVDGNTYIWKFNRKDEDKTLYIEMDSTKVTKEKQEKRKEYNLNMTAFIIFGTIAIIAVIFILYVALKRKRVNKI